MNSQTKLKQILLDKASSDPVLSAERRALFDSFSRRLDADWNEEQHPRAADGKFGGGGGSEGGGSGGSRSSVAEGHATKASQFRALAEKHAAGSQLRTHFEKKAAEHERKAGGTTRQMTPVERAASPKTVAGGGRKATPSEPGKPVGPAAETRAVPAVQPKVSAEGKASDLRIRAQIAGQAATKEGTTAAHGAAAEAHREFIKHAEANPDAAHHTDVMAAKQRFEEHARNSGAAPLEATASSVPEAAKAPTAKSGDFESRFHAAFDKEMAKSGKGAFNLLHLHDMRGHFPELSSEDFNKGLRGLREKDQYLLQPDEGRHGRLTEQQVKAGINEGGRSFHYVTKRRRDSMHTDDDRDRLEELYSEIYADDDDAEDPEDLSDEELAQAILARTDSAHRIDSAERTATAQRAGGAHLVAYALALHPRYDASEAADQDEDVGDGGADEAKEGEAGEEKCPGCGKMVTPKDGKCPECGASMKSGEAAAAY